LRFACLHPLHGTEKTATSDQSNMQLLANCFAKMLHPNIIKRALMFVLIYQGDS